MPKKRKAKRMWNRIIICTMLAVLSLGIYASYSIVMANSFEPSQTQVKPLNVISSNIDLDWNLTLVNSANYMPANYQVKLMSLSNGIQIDERIYTPLQQMFDDARKDGVYPIVRDGYRTQEEQERLMSDKIKAFESEGHSKERAKELAEGWVAIPGTSEHQLGIAIDINADSEKSTNEVVYNWLADNSYKYGFILRYPKNKTEMTGIQYEPWHYRYVGEEAAREIYSLDLCLEEYLVR